MGAEDDCGTCKRRARTYVYAEATGGSEDVRRALECRATADGGARMDAQLYAHVLGKENLGVDTGYEVGNAICNPFKRQIPFGWTRSEWLWWHCMGDSWKVRQGLGRASCLRENSIYVRRFDGTEVRLETIFRTKLLGVL